VLVIFLSSWGRNPFGDVLVPVRAACTLPGLWHCFGWALAKGVLEGRGGMSAGECGRWASSFSKVCADLLCEETKCSGLAGRGMSIGEHRGQGMLLAI